MNNGKLSLQNPDNLKNKIARSRTDSIDIPRWDNFQETNNEIPSMDYSPIYDESSPEAQMRKKPPQKNIQLQTQSPIRVGNLNENNGIFSKIYDWWFGTDID